MTVSIHTNQYTLTHQLHGKSKGKVVPVPFLNEYHAIERYWGVEV
jgi:hypothetical protein